MDLFKSIANTDASRLSAEDMKIFNEAINEYSKAMSKILEIQRKTIPKCIKVNKKWLNKLINNGTIKEFEFHSNGEMYANLESYDGLPVEYDDSISTYELVFDR